jgi:hypothetical protein
MMGGTMKSRPTLILHIGPMKTGTTSLQFALHRSRKLLASHGIRYLADYLHGNSNTAALGLIGPDGLTQGEWHYWDRREDDWKRLRQQLLDPKTQLTVVSGEAFAECDDHAISRLRAELSAYDVHLVLTLRRLSALVPSVWQESAKRRPYPSLSEFSDRLLSREVGDEISNRFWRCQEHDMLIRRWQLNLQPTKTTIIIPDKSEPNLLLSAFATVMGIPKDAASELVNAAKFYKNRSRTAEEMALRQKLFKQLQESGLMDSARIYSQRMVHSGEDRVPLLDEHDISLDNSARKEWLPIEKRMVSALRDLKVQSIGDIGSLVSPSVSLHEVDGQSRLSVDGLLDASSHLVSQMLLGAGVRQNGESDLSWLAKHTRLSHLWSLVLINTFWFVVPRRVHPYVRRFIWRIRQ